MNAQIQEWTPDEYHSDPGGPRLSASTATMLLTQSPKHVYESHPLMGGEPFEASSSMDQGSVIHAMVLGKGAKYECIDGFGDWRTKASKERRAEVEESGRIALLAKDYYRARETAAAITARLTERGVQLGSREVPITWREDGVDCRCMIDSLLLGPHSAEIVDLKTGYSAHPDSIRRHMEAFGCDIQRESNVRAVEALRPDLIGRVRMRFVFAETSRPYCVTVAEPSEQMVKLGELRWRRAKEVWKTCLDLNRWPEYAESTVTISPRQWTLEQEMEHHGESL